MMSEKEKEHNVLNPRGSGDTHFVTDKKEEKYLKKHIIPKLKKSA